MHFVIEIDRFSVYIQLFFILILECKDYLSIIWQ